MNDNQLISNVLQQAKDIYLSTKIDIKAPSPRISNYKKIDNIKSSNIKDYFVPTEEEAKIYKRFIADYTIGNNNRNASYEHLNYRSPLQAQDFYFKLYMALFYWSENDKYNKKAHLSRQIIMNKSKTYIANNSTKILFGSPKAKNPKGDSKLLNYALQNANDSVVKEYEYKEALRQMFTATCYTPTAFVMKTYDYKFIHDGDTKRTDWYSSGHSHNVVDAREMMIANPNETDIQEQPFVIRERYITIDDAEDLYGKHNNFKWIKQGYNHSFGYDIETDGFTIELNKDEDSSFYLVKETTVWYRFKNRKYTFINGVIVSDKDSKMERKDGLYPFEVKRKKTIPGQFYGVCLAQEFEQIESYASEMLTLVSKMGEYAVKPAMLVVGKNSIDKRYLRSGAVLESSDQTLRIDPIKMGGDLNTGIALLQKVESMGQEVISDQLSGLPVGGKLTATQSKIIENNSNTVVTDWLDDNAAFVKKYSLLIIGDILQHDLTVKIDENTNELIYKDIVNKGVLQDGKVKDVVIRPITPQTKLTLSQTVDKLKELGEYDYQPEIDFLLDNIDENDNQEIILFDTEEISQMMVTVDIDIEYLSNRDKTTKRAEFNEMLSIVGPLGALDPQKTTKYIVEDYLGDKASDILSEQSTPFDTGNLSNQTLSSQVLNNNAQTLQA